MRRERAPAPYVNFDNENETIANPNRAGRGLRGPHSGTGHPGPDKATRPSHDAVRRKRLVADAAQGKPPSAYPIHHGGKDVAGHEYNEASPAIVPVRRGDPFRTPPRMKVPYSPAWASRTFNTSGTVFLGLTLYHTPAIRPASSIRKAERVIPRNVLPYSFF